MRNGQKYSCRLVGLHGNTDVKMLQRLNLSRTFRSHGRTFMSRANWLKPLSNGSRLNYINCAVGVVVVGMGLVYFKQHFTVFFKKVYCLEKAKKFANKSIVITGAAGDIGSATARAFAQEGASVMLVDLNATIEKMKGICSELKALGASQAEWITCDVTDVGQVAKMIDCSIRKFGQIDFFFNNAGIQGTLLPIHKQDEAAFKKLIDINIYGMFLAMKYVSSAMIAAGKGGVIVNTASLAGLIGPPNMIAYAASKFAVVGMTKTAAKDLAEHNIRVCAIAPALIEGRLWSTQVKGQAQCRKRITGSGADVTDEEVMEQENRMIGSVPMKRLGKLTEIASVVLFLCSEDASYLTGTVVPIDGGKLL